MNKAILFFAVLFVVPFIFQEAEAVLTNASLVEDGRVRDTGDNDVCSLFNTITSGELGINYGAWSTATTNADCDRAYAEFNITPIPSNAIILKVEFEHFNGGTFDCQIRNADNRPTTSTAANLAAGIASGTLYFTSPAGDCFDTAAEPRTTDLGASAVTDMQTAVDASQVWYAIGLKLVSESIIGSNRINGFGSEESPSAPSNLMITWELPPDAVDDLAVVAIGGNTIDIEWTEPELNQSILSGYQINFTTPTGDPNTIITNDTGSDDTTTTITGLNQDTPYSFRLSVVTEGGLKNATGNVLDVLTADFGNFTVGFFDINATGLDSRDIKYQRIDIANDIVKLEVTYPNAFNLTCTFDYRFQNTNQSFSNLATVPVSTSEQRATFQFNNASREFIGINCLDENTNVTAPFQLTITQFPILDQLQAFRAGEFGTDGMLGAVDIITLGVIILVMIGFNRWNESVGAIFAVGVLGGLAFFQIVEWQTFMFGTFAIVIMLVIASTRKAP